MAGSALRIGIVACTQLQQHTLRVLVEECGHRVETTLLVTQVVADDSRGDVSEVDAWLVDVNNNDDTDWTESDALESWFDSLSAPIIFCDGDIPNPQQDGYRAWSRRLRDKLNQVPGSINLAQTGAARNVWVLAASTGGPSAVKQFLSELPPKLNIGFVYVQHIDKGFDNTLAQVMSRHTHYPAKLAEHGAVIEANIVSIVRPDRATAILPNGTFLVEDGPWIAPYRPSVDSVVADVAHHYGSRAGVIVFTGMGDDGAASARMMKQKGGKVWAQTPSSCTSDSMPQAAIATGCVEFKGTPFTLAQHLVKNVQQAKHQPASVVVNQ